MSVLRLAAAVLFVVSALGFAVALCVCIGAMMLAASMAMLDADLRLLAFAFCGVPWAYLTARFILWIAGNLKQQSEDRLGWKEGL